MSFECLNPWWFYKLQQRLVIGSAFRERYHIFPRKHKPEAEIILSLGWVFFTPPPGRESWPLQVIHRHSNLVAFIHYFFHSFQYDKFSSISSLEFSKTGSLGCHFGKVPSLSSLVTSTYQTFLPVKAQSLVGNMAAKTEGWKSDK